MKNKKPEIYTIANAHLDTSWLWTLERTIDEYIPETLKGNFEYLEKYPEYKFNFEGSYRYELIKEYYPEYYEKLKKYISDGRWNSCGAPYKKFVKNIVETQRSNDALAAEENYYGNKIYKSE